MRIFSLLLLIPLSSLCADTVSSDELNSIYIEAVLFVLVFGVMGVVSYIYSSRHAKAYKAKKEEVTEDRVKKDRIKELKDLHEKELIDEKEFELLKEYYLKQNL